MGYKDKIDLHRFHKYSTNLVDSADNLRPIATLNQIQLRQSNDVYEHACNITGWQQLYNQIQPGEFSGYVKEGWIEGIQFFKEYTSKLVQQKCMVWPGAIWIGIPVPNNSEHGMIGHNELADNLVGIQIGGQEFGLNTPDDYTILGLVVDLSLLESYFEVFLQRPLPLKHLASQMTIAMQPTDKLRLCNTIEVLLEMAQHTPHILNNEATLKTLRYDLLDLLDLLFHNIDQSPRIVLPKSRLNHINIVQKAHEFILDNARCRDEMTILDICEYLHISRRTLQTAFNNIWHVSPVTYLKAIKLNAVRRELKSPYSEFITVQDAAMAWGFWHMGQFSQDYQSLFKERPSQTLNQRLRFH
ncbi:ethanolamine utilization protein EutR [Ignatzschineria ureiclastica]|uniref:Ethanolamine utilization protein EutR n=1 Tax=Ignatzschineria ureiclastica TaxID=472582 RepID=A0A2U2ACG5_9GAMM|nr:helix-turn-helix domain-containing protein [Ignatzschineria ureiclastica]PWD80346.1 ethanolamine utilization protein EutR [Ignatzschineria ureiclastica]GHA00207.1 AraC family transcriptional regulator [Ignatzschineria ureiclastica]